MTTYSADCTGAVPSICDGIRAGFCTFLGASPTYIMHGMRTSDSVWVTWTVYGSPDTTGAQYTLATLTAGSIYCDQQEAS